MGAGRKGSEVAEILVHGYERSLVLGSRLSDRGIRVADQSFIRHGGDVVARLQEQARRPARQVLVELEPQDACESRGKTSSRGQGSSISGGRPAGGRVIKLIGDEVMFVADDARDSCEIALRLVDAFHDDELLPPVRGGLAWGETITQEGDYFGPVVNLAARATKVAQPENVLVPESITQEVSHARLT
ncbi:MAG: hypothetical protein GEU78_17765 [Actinobacteria bacterium]|nr:hypothetical protein [Actinomycetota bacterium]